MLKKYFSIAFRNLLKNKTYSLINILGLSLGITCSVLILLYIQDELKYDKYHKKSDRIYRVYEQIKPVEKSASLPFPVVETLKADYPNYIEEYVRFFNLQAPTLSIEYAPELGSKIQFNEPHVFFVDSTLFKIFDFRLKSGNQNVALSRPFSIIVTESMAKKYFKNENPIGKVLSFEGKYNLNVTGVLEDIPQNSHFKIDFLISFSSLEIILDSGIPKVWFWNPCWSYILLKQNVNPASLESIFPDFVTRRYPPKRAENTSLYMQSLNDIHLNSNLDYEIEANSDIKLVYILGIIAAFILLIATINFINLSTARSMIRAKEVGVRKVLGAEKYQLVGQFLFESVLLTCIAVLISIPSVDFLIPVLNSIALKEISSSYLLNWVYWFSLIMVIFIVGLLGGIYPALFLSSFNPVKIISGKFSKSSKGVALRKFLVVSQFSVSSILIIGTIITYSQLNHLIKADLGFNKEEIIVIPISRTPLVNNYFLFKDRIKQNKNIKNVSVANLIIGTESQSSRYYIEGNEEEIPLNTYWISTDFGKTLDLTFLAGRDLSTSFPSDTATGGGGAIVNESFVKFAGWSPESAVGKLIKVRADGQLEIKGVVKDFNFNSLKHPIVPLVMVIRTVPKTRLPFMKFIYVRTETKDLNSVIQFLEKNFKEIDPDRSFSYSFLNEKINKLYSSENSLSELTMIFAFLAIFVACLGLYGLTSSTVEQRTKEIGIRKVIGAKVSGIVFLISRQLLFLVAIANILAWPIAYYLMNYWLNDFQSKIIIDIIPFLAATLFSFILAFLTMSFQVIKSATANPIKSLKYE